MKRSIRIIVIMAFMLTLTACAQGTDMTNLPASEYGELEDAGIVMRVVGEVTTETDSVMIEYVNNTDAEAVFGKEPHLEIERDGSWYVLPIREDAAWEDIGYILPPNGSDEKEFSLRLYYGELDPGHYRIVKMLYADSNSIAAAAEFDIQ